ncbi:MAG: mechanosensitive ion channel family protein [Halocynthiibacter sp.]
MASNPIPVSDEINTFFNQITTFAENLLLPTQLKQVAIIIGITAISLIVKSLIAPKMHNWMRDLEGRPKWQLRWLLHFQKRIGRIVFVILIWLVTAFRLEVLDMFPSHVFLLRIAGAITLTWLLIGLVTRGMHNRLLRDMVRWGAWIYVTLYFLGFLEATQDILESLAINLGDMRLSIYGFIKAIVVMTSLFFIARYLSRTTSTQVQKNEDLSPSMRVLLIKFAQILLYGVTFFLGLKAVGFDLTGLAFLSGAIGVGLGFGLQKIVSNLVSGIIILMDKSIKPGDVISLNDTFGWINSLGARYVSVVTRDGKEYLIPNEDLITNQVVNWSHTDDYVRLDIFFGTAYGDDPHLVRKLAVGAAKSVDRVLTLKSPVCHIVGFGDSSVDYILRFWIADPTGGLTNIRGGVYLALWDAFKEHDISIPFPQRELRMLEEKAEKTVLD